ncbi:MAG: hypothetical protein GY774_07040 [Planctomycetes bacterium]|nr:hypothetical protein [Planctomycetota bacterium]
MKWQTVRVLVTAAFLVVAPLASESVLADLYAIDSGGSVYNALTGDLFSNPLSGPRWAEGLTYVPIPSAVILGSLGLTFSGWLLHRKKRSDKSV